MSKCDLPASLLSLLLPPVLVRMAVDWWFQHAWWGKRGGCCPCPNFVSTVKLRGDIQAADWVVKRSSFTSIHEPLGGLS